MRLSFASALKDMRLNISLSRLRIQYLVDIFKLEVGQGNEYGSVCFYHWKVLADWRQAGRRNNNRQL